MLAVTLIVLLNRQTMRRTRHILTAITAALMLALFESGLSSIVAADPANVPSLTISQLKITSSNGQFITLYNSTGSALDMSKYQLEYFNSYDLAKATSSRLIALSGTVPPHGYFMVNDSALLLCYQLTVDSVSLGLSSTTGMIEVLAFNQSAPGQSVLPVLQDYVGWSKTAVAGAQTLPANSGAFLQRQPSDNAGNPNVTASGSGSWLAVQPDGGNACNLVSSSQPSVSVASGINQLLPPVEPPASILSLPEADNAPLTGMPASDIGLMAPQLTELLPNPNGTGNDSTDEFIELYNANNTAFDLSGFTLQSGTTSLHKYTFPSGTSMAPHGFKAFYSDDTGLSLSNTSGQVKILDPTGNSLSSTGSYSTAKDGQAWALAKGKWYWTAQPTPGAANVIKQPVPARKTKSTTSSKANHSSGKTTSASNSSALISGSSEAPDTSPVHARALVVVVAAAILYGAYEYRADIRNKLFILRGHLSTGWPYRRKP